MQPRFRAGRATVVAGALLTAALGTAIPATAASAVAAGAPSLITTDYTCAGGVCEIGPGDVGLPFAAGLIGTGGPAYYGPECDAYVMTVTAGNLPPGVTFAQPGCEYIISGTPTRAGTYSFTVQIAPQPDSLGQTGPAGTEQLTITIGTGTSDRLGNVSASYNGHQGKLYISGYEPNVGTLISASLTSTGQQLIAPSSPGGSGFYGTDGHWQLSKAIPDPCGRSDACSLTVTDSLGSSVTVTLPPATY